MAYNHSQQQPFAHVPRVNSRCNSLDVKEIMKNEMHKQSSGQDGAYRMGLPVSVRPSPNGGIDPDRVGFEEVELYFDSVYRDLTSDYSIGELNFSIPTFNNNQTVENCMELTLNSFYFPKINVPANKPEFYYFRRVYMEFVGAPSTQAVLCANNTRFHFEFDVYQINGQCVFLVPTKQNFYFKRPIQDSLTTFQLRFFVPQMTSQLTTMTRIPLPYDTVQVVSLLNAGFGYNPIRFQITTASTNTTILGLVGALTPTPGVAIFITGYNSNDATTNTSVNDSTGIFASTVIDITTFEIAGIDASAVTAQYTAVMFIPKNRIAIPVRFTTVKPTPTNYIDVSHM